jgi:hypothetical protein
MAEANVNQILMWRPAEDCLELSDQLGRGQAGAGAKLREVEGFVEGRMQDVPGGAQSPVNLPFCTEFDGIDLP